MTPEQIAELEALAEKATPGPWVRSNDPKKWVSSLAPVTSQEWRDNVENDAALIATLVNSLPAILAALKAQQPDDAMVRDAIYQLAYHQQQADMDGCMVTVSGQALDEVLVAIAAMQESRDD